MTPRQRLIHRSANMLCNWHDDIFELAGNDKLHAALSIAAQSSNDRAVDNYWYKIADHRPSKAYDRLLAETEARWFLYRKVNEIYNAIENA